MSDIAEIQRSSARLRFLRQQKTQIEREIALVQQGLVALLAGHDEQVVVDVPTWATNEAGVVELHHAAQRVQVNGQDPKVSVNIKLLASERPDLAQAVSVLKTDSDKVKAALKKGMFSPEDIARYFEFKDPAPWVQFYDPIEPDPDAADEDDDAIAGLTR